MTMRAEVQRNTATGTDPHGHPAAPVFAVHATLPCFVWSRQRREVVDGDKQAFVEDLRAMFPLNADIAERDRITSVVDRQGKVILSGRFDVGPIQFKHRHLEAGLERVQ